MFPRARACSLRTPAPTHCTHAHSSPPTHTSRYVLHTMHRNLTEMEVALNCELRNAVKKGDEEAVERLVQQGMPTYHYPSIVAVC